MKVTFNIKYNTVWGERIFLECPYLDSDAKEMHYHSTGEWQLEIQFPASTKEIKYRYLIGDKNGICTPESSKAIHHARFNNECKSYHLYDYWFSEPADRTFYTSAFTKNLFARRNTKATGIEKAGNSKSGITLNLIAPQITPEQSLFIAGNQPCLGNWEPEYAPEMSANTFPHWEILLDSKDITLPLEYKFIVRDNKTKKTCYWEEGENRIVNQLPNTKNSNIVISNNPLRSPEASWKACGTVIPVFSLRSENSFGIGEIGDIKKLIDWTKKTGQHIIQVLPMNDTTRTHTWKDSYPYSAISIYALHPLYISISMMGSLNDKKKATAYSRIQKKLNSKENLDYESVEKHKTAYYRDYFEQEKSNILKSKDFNEFVTENKEWLMPYAAFSYLRDKYNTSEFSKWEKYARYNGKDIEHFCHPESETYNEFVYIFFIQYTLHKQFEAVSDYARKNGVVLKGDIPIGINRESVEAWTDPDYFNMQGQTGAPPDDFSDTGQNWSFPTYNWDIMEKDGFEWWKKRFHKMNSYFDSFRIDHILGFFRIWEIPMEYTDGLCGHFRPALPLPVEEIEMHGMIFDKQWTTPRIHIKFLPEIFGALTENDILKYLSHQDAEHLTLNEICSTQKKIKTLFNNCNDGKLLKIRDGLMVIANEVLFLQDPYDTKCYHPRISAYKSYMYRELSNENKQAFDKLYHEFYFLRHNNFWKETALKRLTPLINNTDMLVCGEDLGMIPASVHEVMKKLQIFTLELERTPKACHLEFSRLRELPYHSVCTTSTHDMTPIRAWWKEDKDKTQRYYNNILQRYGIAPEECSKEIAEQIISNHLQASSMLTIIPLQDWFAIDDKMKQQNADTERINVPANPENYWCYRMHMTIEALLSSNNFNKKVKNIIAENKR